MAYRDPYQEPLEQPGELVVARCGYCGGRGVDPFGCPGPNSACQVCGGGGAVRVTTPYERCATCHGTGKQPGRRLACSACSGKGVKTASGQMAPCPVCRATGVHPGYSARLPCSNCSGLGRVPAASRSPGSALLTSLEEMESMAESEPEPFALETSAPPRIRTTRPPDGPGRRQPIASVAEANPPEGALSAYVSNSPGVSETELRAIFGLSKEGADRVLEGLVHERKLRRRQGKLYPA